MPIITLTTDYGSTDSYVGAMKGVLLSICPKATLVDLTHEIPAYDVTEAAFVFEQARRWFPKKTIHVAVVDPGVGSTRRPLLVEVGGHYLIGPDNGIFTHALGQSGARARVLSNEKLFLKPVSATFHGRDIFAPCAAHLAAGLAPAKLGKLVRDALRLNLGTNQRISKRQWSGTVLRVDRFGNLITSFSTAEFAWLAERPFEIQVGFEKVGRRATHFAECEYGELFAIVGSSGYIEIVQREASAAKRLGVVSGAPVDVTGW
jgi:S-adenosylmethionine hydrolase